MLFTSYLAAQAYPTLVNSNEIKFNMGLFLVLGTVEASYEYYLNEDTSLGALVYFDSKAEDFNGSFGMSGQFRAYFGYHPQRGFFAEAFALYFKGEKAVTSSANITRLENYATPAIGLGAGYKWVTLSNRFIVEINLGLGRNIGQEDFQDKYTYKAGLSLGYRF